MSCNYCIGLILLSIIVVVILSFLIFFRFCLILEWNLLGRGGERIRRIQEEKEKAKALAAVSAAEKEEAERQRQKALDAVRDISSF